MIKSSSHIFNKITSILERGGWIFWSTLFLSIAIGIGQNELSYTTNGNIEGIELITRLVVILLWISVILQAIRQTAYIHIDRIFNRIGNWFLLGASIIFTFRLTYIVLFLDNYVVHMSPLVLVGVSLLGIGLIFNALSDIKNPESFVYGK